MERLRVRIPAGEKRREILFLQSVNYNPRVTATVCTAASPQALLLVIGFHLTCTLKKKKKNARAVNQLVRLLLFAVTSFFTCHVSMRGRCYVWPGLTEFSGVVRSCFTLPLSIIFTEVSPVKPDLAHVIAQRKICSVSSCLKIHFAL